MHERLKTRLLLSHPPRAARTQALARAMGGPWWWIPGGLILATIPDGPGLAVVDCNLGLSGVGARFRPCPLEPKARPHAIRRCLKQCVDERRPQRFRRARQERQAPGLK